MDKDRLENNRNITKQMTNESKRNQETYDQQPYSHQINQTTQQEKQREQPAKETRLEIRNRKQTNKCKRNNKSRLNINKHVEENKRTCIQQQMTKEKMHKHKKNTHNELIKAKKQKTKTLPFQIPNPSKIDSC